MITQRADFTIQVNTLNIKINDIDNALQQLSGLIAETGHGISDLNRIDIDDSSRWYGKEQASCEDAYNQCKKAAKAFESHLITTESDLIRLRNQVISERDSHNAAIINLTSSINSLQAQLNNLPL